MTGLVITGWNALAEGRKCAGMHFAELLLGHLDRAPWLYIAEAIFGIACCAIVSGSAPLDRVYAWLAQSQYIYVMLGLQPTPHTNLPLPIPVAPTISALPGHILCSDVFHPLPKERRIELRTVAIGAETATDSLYRALLDTMCGRRGRRDRVAALRPHAVP